MHLIPSLLNKFIRSKISIKVSILIPVYNAENHIKACLESALNQTLKNIEIICIDDHSTDNSLNILTIYSSHDPRITIIKHEINRGEGEARNTGINHAKGEYIFHLDSDDTLPTDAIETLYNIAIKHDSDLVKGRFDIVNKNGTVRKDTWSTPSEPVINTNIFDSAFLQTIPTSHVSYLYSRKLITNNRIRYNTHLSVGLDIVTLTQVLTCAKNVSLVPRTVYYYHQTDSSVTRGNISLKIAKDSVRAKALTAKLLDECGLRNAAISRLKAWEYIIDAFWSKMTSSLTPIECFSVFSEFRDLLSQYRINEPWRTTTPTKYRHILELITTGRDVEAFSELKTLSVKV